MGWASTVEEGLPQGNSEDGTGLNRDECPQGIHRWVGPRLGLVASGDSEDGSGLDQDWWPQGTHRLGQATTMVTRTNAV